MCPNLRFLSLPAALMLAMASLPVLAARPPTGFQGTAWGDETDALRSKLGAIATPLAEPIDFGDAYVDLVLKDWKIGGYPMIVLFELDKTTHGLKRIQIERQRHGAVKMVATAVLDGLVKTYGTPDEKCSARTHNVAGQSFSEMLWHKGQNLIRAVYRDQSLNTLNPYLARAYGDAIEGNTIEGLPQQLIVRIAPAKGEPDDCVSR